MCWCDGVAWNVTAAFMCCVSVSIRLVFVTRWDVSGDFGLDPLALTRNPAKKARYELSELAHCRLAMFAISGICTQSVLCGGDFPYQVPY